MAASGVRGFCGIGIVGGKSTLNVGTLWRSAANLGASYIFTAGRRYPDQAADTVKAWRHIPMFEFAHEHMASLGADLCIAFWDGRSSGTADMVDRAERHGITVELWVEGRPYGPK